MIRNTRKHAFLSTQQFVSTYVDEISTEENANGHVSRDKNVFDTPGIGHFTEFA